MVDQQFYQEFVSAENLPDNLLFDVLTASNYMEIPALLDLAVLKVTFDIQGKNAEEVGCDGNCLYYSSSARINSHPCAVVHRFGKRSICQN